MKTALQKLRFAPSFVAISALYALPVMAQSLTATTTPVLTATPQSRRAAIPFDQIAAMAGKQNTGDGLTVVSSPEGARLRCAYQRLDGRATTEGLWLYSTSEGAKGVPFRVVARKLARDDAETLPLTGRVEVDGPVARFIRPGLTEEYSAGIDGLRQDFVIEQRPKGNGPTARLELDVQGATVGKIADGAQLVLSDGGRKIIYHRLKAKDARGHNVKARMEILPSNRLAIVLEDAAAEYPVCVDPTFSDVNWFSFGGYPGPNFEVLAVAADGAGNIYIGGGFNLVGNTPANYIAKWNGSSWSALGTGMDADVDALLYSGGTLYAGGYFLNAGGNSANYIAQWNGSTWSPLGAGVSGDVTAMVMWNGDLYVSGGFGIEEWNGSSWSFLGTAPQGRCDALAASTQYLYASGLFSNSVTWASGVGRWDGSEWSALLSVTNGDNGVSGGGALALAVIGTNLYAGGTFTNAGGYGISYIAEFVGNYWVPLGSGVNGYVETMLVSGTNLYVGGEFDVAGGASAGYVAEWNGSSWSTLSGGVNSDVTALASSGTNLLVGGYFTAAVGGTIPASYIAQWSGTTWSSVSPANPSALNGDVYALAVSGTNLYAAGGFGTAGGLVANCIAEWNGHSWTNLGSGITGQVAGYGLGPYVYSLALSGSNVYAGGTFAAAGGLPATNVARWNGHTWSAVGSGQMNGFSVEAMASIGTNVYIGGFFYSVGGILVTDLAQWNGSTWSGLGSGVNGIVDAFDVSGTNLIVGGGFNTAGGVAINGIGEWNGHSWSGFGSGVSGVHAIAGSPTNLYVGGSFTTAGGNPADYIAEWNGSTWSAVGGGMNYFVYSLTLAGTNLFAGGTFSTAGGGYANCIAVWNGSTWSALGGSVNDQVNAIYVSGNNLFAGGNFTSAGGVVSVGLAQAILWPPAIITNDGNFGFNKAHTTFGFDVSAGALETIEVQGSTNLMNWESLMTEYPSNAVWNFSDTSVGSFPRRYYQLVFVP